MVQPLWKTVWRFLKKLETELPYDPAILLLELKENEETETNSKRYMHLNVHRNVIYNSQNMKTTYVSINR